MAVTSYPNISITSTTTTVSVHANGGVITSTYASSVNLVFPSVLPAGFMCWVTQLGAGQVGLTAGSGATVNSSGGTTGTSTQYSVAQVIAYTDGNFIAHGDVA